MMNSTGRVDWLGRVVGMAIFLLGVGLLIFVFSVAYQLFAETPAAALGIKFTGDARKDPAAAVIGAQFAWLILRIGYLLIMSLAGSLIANKGINLYFSTALKLDPAKPAVEV